MTIEIWVAFSLASCLLLVIPGPTILTVISYSVSHGSRVYLPLISAVALGDATALVLSIAGLGAVLATSAWLFTVVKWIGGLYLIYLGVRLFRARLIHSDSTVVETDQTSSLDSKWALFRNTWLVTALNPKGIVFFVAFLPQFIDTTVATAPQLWILSVTFVVLATINALLYVVFAVNARRLLTSPTAQKRFNLGGGSLLILAGGWALTARQVS